jgi:hypothetical protein
MAQLTTHPHLGYMIKNIVTLVITVRLKHKHIRAGGVAQVVEGLPRK